MAIPYVKVKVRGVVVGTLHLLGSEMKIGGLCHVLVSSNGTMSGFTSICEGVFLSVERIIDNNGKDDTVFFGKARITARPEKSSVGGKVKELKALSQRLEERLERSCRIQSP